MAAARAGTRSKTSLTLTVHVDGLREVLAVLNKLPKEANQQLRDRSQKIAKGVAEHVQQAGRALGGQAAAVAATVTTRRDRVPVISVGGTRRIGRHGAPAYGLLFGSEFGQNRRSGWFAANRYAASEGRQYKPHRGRNSYWIFKTVDEHAVEIFQQWADAADEIVRDVVRKAR